LRKTDIIAFNNLDIFIFSFRIVGSFLASLFWVNMAQCFFD